MAWDCRRFSPTPTKVAVLRKNFKFIRCVLVLSCPRRISVTGCWVIAWNFMVHMVPSLWLIHIVGQARPKMCAGSLTTISSTRGRGIPKDCKDICGSFHQYARDEERQLRLLTMSRAGHGCQIKVMKWILKCDNAQSVTFVFTFVEQHVYNAHKRWIRYDGHVKNRRRSKTLG